jgi:AraC-like DNA-binding protein
VRLFSSKSTFFKMIVSYLMVLAIPLAFGISLFATTLGITRQTVEEANLSILNNVRDNVNISLSGISNMMRALLSDSNITSLSAKSSYTTQDYSVMGDLQKTISMSLLSNSYVDDILIYFHKSDFVLSSKSYLSGIESMTGYSGTVGLDVSNFAEQVKQIDNYTLQLGDSNYGPTAFITTQGASRNGEDAVVTVLVRLKSSLLADMIVSNDCATFIVDASGNALSSGGAAQLGGSVGTWYLEGDDGKNQCIETVDDSFQIHYVRFVPSAIYYQHFFNVLVLFFIFLALCLGLGIPLVVSAARRSYHPIQEILSLISQPQDERDSDDYMIIRSSLTSLLQKNKDYEVERDNRTMALRSYLLYRLLNSPDMKESVFLEECCKCEITFENTCFLLIGFSVENGSNLFFKQDESVNEDMSHFLVVAITNVLRDVFTEDYSFFTAEYRGAYYAVVNVNARLDREVVLDEIKNSCVLAADRLDSDFRVTVSIAVSNVHTGYQKIRRCYEEIEEITRRQNYLKRTAYVIQHHELDPLVQKDQLESLSVSGQGSGEKKESEKRVSAQEISGYIDEHFSDPDLTVGALSERFGMTTANLSLMFKRKLGISPLEYIQQKRVEEAKRLLDSTQMKVSDISKNVGYYDSRPLMRAFRRIEGTTPAEYREQNKSL